MAFLKNTVSLLAVFCVIPAAFGASPRVSVVGAATSSARVPSVNTYVGTTTSSTTSTTTSTTLLGNTECIDTYTSCIRGNDVCGSDLEECTTNVLFHGKMPSCISSLSLCSASGINALFGTSSINNLSKVETRDSKTNEVTRYTYPTDGSVLGQMILGAEISNRFPDVSTCVKKYKSCVYKDSVCGEDFELCTDQNSFNKQAVFCDSVLARCTSDGIENLFGVKQTTRPLNTSSYKIGQETMLPAVAQWISDGADLAASNAVNTCYKVIDNCFLSACANNPYSCVEGTPLTTIATADLVGAGEDASRTVSSDTGVQSAADVKKFFKSACLDTIGTNKYCYMVFNEGKTPKKSDLTDPDSQEDLFSEAYSARKTYLNTKLQDLVTKFDSKAKDNCKDTIRSCAMRSCGGGVGAACYSLVFGPSGKKSINGSDTYPDIANACSAVVNADVNCRYSAAVVGDSATYTYMYNDNGAFGVLFPEYDALTKNDPIGAVASLNSSLSTSYNDAAIANMKKQCQSVATSCVKAMCGADYTNCYRNRTDIYSSLTNSGDAAYDKSMNKVGGVLDYTIVLGLCLDTVKNADVCTEHLAIAQTKVSRPATNAWGSASSVRGGWLDSGSASDMKENIEQVQEHDEDGNPICTTKSGAETAVCNTVDSDGNVYDQPVMISYTTYVETQAASSLFKDLVYDIEKEAQAKYNAKLTKQQNMCMSGNSGGVMGASDTGSTYQWVKLQSNKVASSYAVNGLKTSQFTPSNDLYGSFCRLKITVQSDDKYIQEAIRNGKPWSTAYFAAGDPFTCGSWIPEDDLKDITNDIRKDAISKGTKTSQDWTLGLLTTLGALGGGTGGFALANNLQNGDGIAGLISKNDGKRTLINRCNTAKTAVSNALITTKSETGDCSGVTARLANAVAVFKTAYKAVARDANFTDLDAVISSNPFVYNKEANTCGIENTSGDIHTELAKFDCDVSNNADVNDRGVKGGLNWAGAGIGAVLTGGLTYTTVKAIQNSNNENARDAAAAEWMNEIGNKIKCYIGSDEVGSYGDIISTELE